jgi:hypothetical protein
MADIGDDRLPLPMFLLQPNLPADNSTTWLLVGLAMLTIMYVIIRPMMRRRRDPLEGGSSSPFRLSPSQQRQVEQQMSSLLVELAEMARQVSSQLDTRSQKLEVLIQQADERIEALGRAGQAPATGRPTLRLAATDEGPDPRHTQVYDLADQGLNSRQIADRLGRASGEVELILALRPKQA